MRNSHGGLPTQTNDDPDAPSQHELSSPEAIDKQPVEEVPGDSDKVKETQQQQRKGAFDTKTGEELRIVLFVIENQ